LKARAARRLLLFASGTALALGGPAAPAAADPRLDYMLQCQGCHRADGSGSPGGVPDLREHLGDFATMPGGREYLVRVPGSAQSPLSDGELAAVLNWMIRRFGSADAADGFVPFSADEVGRVRRPLADVEAVRRGLLDRIAPARLVPR